MKPRWLVDENVFATAVQFGLRDRTPTVSHGVLTRIESDDGHREDAIAAATKAYSLAWCDDPPYAYHFGLTTARERLQELGGTEPELPPFDQSKFTPMPTVEVNRHDKFWVDPTALG